MTPPEIERWKKRAVVCAALRTNSCVTMHAALLKNKGLFHKGKRFGKHEVIVETPEHLQQFTLPVGRIAQYLKLLFKESACTAEGIALLQCSKPRP